MKRFMCYAGAILGTIVAAGISNYPVQAQPANFCQSPPAGQTMEFCEDFNAPVDYSAQGGRWFFYDSNEQLGRTRFKFQPLQPAPDPDGTRFVRMELNRYHPLFPGQFFLGKQIVTRRRFPLTGTGGGPKRYDARIRITKIRTGTVQAFFTYATGNTRGDEIDYEFLGNTLPNNQLWLNVWNNATDLEAVLGANAPLKTVTGVTWSNWNLYTIQWYSDRVEWYINNALVRLEPNPRPDEAMALHLNNWAPDSSIFPQAFYAGFTPTANASEDVSHYFDVDWVRVTTIGTPTASALRSADLTSDVQLSSATADAKSSSISLAFTGPLDPKVASDTSRYLVLLNGGTTEIKSATYQAATNTVILELGDGVLLGQKDVGISCYDLRDSNGLKLNDQDATAQIAEATLLSRR